MSYEHGYTEDGFKIYAQQALGHKVMTKEEEVEIGKWSIEGYEWAIEVFVIRNLKFVAFIAGTMKRITLPMSDKVQEGNIGLMRAAEKFDYRTGNKFNSYSVWWIKSNIERLWARMGNAVSIPITATTIGKGPRQVMEEYYVKYKQEISVKELAHAAGCTEDFAKAIIASRQKYSSMEDVQPGSETRTRLDMLEDPAEEAIRTDGSAIASVVIERGLEGIDPRGDDIVRMRNGLAPYKDEHTLDEVGKKWGVSRERSRQIHDEMVAILKRRVKRKKFIEDNKGIVPEARRAGLVYERK